MSYKCEVCKRNDAKRQYVGETKRGEGKKELYVCEDCYAFLDPSPTWRSLRGVLKFQKALPSECIGQLESTMTNLVSVVLKCYHEIENTLVYDIPNFYDEFEGFELVKIDDLERSHNMKFCRPEDEGTVRKYPITFDGEKGAFYVSLNPFNEYKLKNMIVDATRKVFPPAYDYVGVGLVTPCLDVKHPYTEFMHSVFHVAQIISQLSDK